MELQKDLIINVVSVVYEVGVFCRVGTFGSLLTPYRYKIFTKLEVEQTFYLESVNNGPNGYPLGNQTRIYIRNNHLQYAFTWLMIAMGLIGVFFAANIKRVKK